jgi:hypothetical protein
MQKEAFLFKKITRFTIENEKGFIPSILLLRLGEEGR